MVKTSELIGNIFSKLTGFVYKLHKLQTQLKFLTHCLGLHV